MKFAYADPPYPRQAARHYEGKEVNHPLLVAYLMDEFPDGWVLSSGQPSMQEVWALCPPGTRVGIWVKTGWISYRPGVNPAYAWEPVFWYGGRRRAKGDDTFRDWDAAEPTRMRGTHGAKPDKFCQWVFQLLNMEPADTLCDVFPGSGAVTRAWADMNYQREMNV